MACPTYQLAFIHRVSSSTSLYQPSFLISITDNLLAYVAQFLQLFHALNHIETAAHRDFEIALSILSQLQNNSCKPGRQNETLPKVYPVQPCRA